MDRKDRNVLAASYPSHERIVSLVDNAMHALAEDTGPAATNAKAFLRALQAELAAPRED